VNSTVALIFSGIGNLSRTFSRPHRRQQPQEGLGASYDPRQWMEDYYGVERVASTASNGTYRISDYKDDQGENTQG